MPKYWVKNYFAHGSFPEVGQKQKTEKKTKQKIAQISSMDYSQYIYKIIFNSFPIVYKYPLAVQLLNSHQLNTKYHILLKL